MRFIRTESWRSLLRGCEVMLDHIQGMNMTTGVILYIYIYISLIIYIPMSDYLDIEEHNSQG